MPQRGHECGRAFLLIDVVMSQMNVKQLADRLKATPPVDVAAPEGAYRR
jgi:hypothetical protein